MDWIKRHPYLSGSLVLVAIILFVIIRRARGAGGGGGTQVIQSGPSEALQAAQLQAGTQTQLAQTAATAQQNQVNAQLAAVQVQSAADVTKAQLAQQAQLQAIVTGGGVESQRIAASTEAEKTAASYAFETAKAQIGGQVSLADIQAQGALGLAQIQTSGQVAIAGQAAQVNEDQIAAAIKEQQIISGTQLGLAATAADVQKYTVGKQADIAYTQLTQSGMTTRAGISATEAIDLSKIKTAGDVAKMQLSTDVQKAGYQQNVELQMIQTQGGTQAGVLDLLQKGKLGNPNRAGVAAGLLGYSPATIAGPGNAANASIFQGFTSMIGNIGSALVGGL